MGGRRGKAFPFPGPLAAARFRGTAGRSAAAGAEQIESGRRANTFGTPCLPARRPLIYADGGMAFRVDAQRRAGGGPRDTGNDMIGRFLLGAGALLTGASHTGAQAAVLTFQTNFAATFAGSAPAGTASGAMKITYNTTSRAYSLDYFSMLIGDQSYRTGDATIVLANYIVATGISWPLFLVGGLTNGNNMAGRTNDFMIGYNGYTRTITDLSYTTASSSGIHAASTITLGAYDPAAIVPPAVAAVPEPVTWALLTAGFGMVGAAMRRRRAGIRFA